MKFRPTIHYSMIQGIFWGSFAPIFAFASVYLLAKGFTNSQVGYILAIGSGLTSILQPIVGAHVDQKKQLVLHRIIIVFSLLVILLCGVLFGFGKNYYLIALGYALIITFAQAITPLTYSLGMFFIARGVPINFGIARGIGSISYAVVAGILGVIVERMDEEIVPIAIGVLFAIFIVVIATFHFDGVEETKDKVATREPLSFDGIQRFIAANKAFAMVLFGNIFVFVSHNMVCNYLFQIVSYHGFGSKEMGFANSLAAACELPTLFLLSTINKRISTVNLFRTSAIFIFLKNLCLCLATGLPMIYFAMSLQLLGYGLFAGISVIYVKETVEEQNQTRGQALMTMTTTLGAVIGNILGGSLIDTIQVPGMLLVSGLMAAFGAVIITIHAGNSKIVAQ